ncbi:unnamed protein product [Paramecium sonneborni]|uniref:Uncharacterized protein n=1 Tax=Paramecium sonneborni TaxID=65129 RepID=A0A8S1LI22_9CILI|nr:unnamed protein product [Paramecium sonneborni]
MKVWNSRIRLYFIKINGFLYNSFRCTTPIKRKYTSEQNCYLKLMKIIYIIDSNQQIFSQVIKGIPDESNNNTTQ